MIVIHKGDIIGKCGRCKDGLVIVTEDFNYKCKKCKLIYTDKLNKLAGEKLS